MSHRKLFNPDNHKTYRGIAEDAAIIAGHAVFVRLAAFSGTPAEAAWTAFLTFGLAFFTQLAYEHNKRRTQSEKK